MITALVLSERGVEALAATLAALVPAVVAGLVGDAVILAREAGLEVGTVADAAGANLVLAPPGSDPWRAGAAAARRDWVLCLEAGDVPGEGWIRALDRFLALGPPSRRFGRLRRRPRGTADLLAALVPRGPRRLRGGDLVHRSLILGDGPARLPRPAPIEAFLARDPALARSLARSLAR